MNNLKEKAVGLATACVKACPDLKKRQNKLENILIQFLDGHTLNRFEAEKLNDHCLNSTVATLGKFGILIDRKFEIVPCLGGKATISLKRYWLKPEPENISNALDLICGNSRRKNNG